MARISQYTALAVRLQKGDREAGAAIFDYLSPLVFRFFMVRLGERMLAEDLTQDVFLKLLSRVETFDETRGNFLGWFWQIARNALADYYRKQKPLPLSEVMERTHASLVSRPAALEARVLLRELLTAVQQFTEEEQELFSLRHLAGLSYKEISTFTGRSPGALRVLAHRLTQKVKAIAHD